MPLPKSLTKVATGASTLKAGNVGREHLNSLLAPAVVPTFTVATLPSAATYKGQILQCSNGSAGSNCLAWSDGTNWKVIALGATCSAT